MAKAATISSQVLQDKFYCRLFSQVSLTHYKDTDRSIASVRGAPERDAVEREIGIPTICVCFLQPSNQPLELCEAGPRIKKSGIGKDDPF
jgi:hypothetical protein